MVKGRIGNDQDGLRERGLPTELSIMHEDVSRSFRSTMFKIRDHQSSRLRVLSNATIRRVTSLLDESAEA